MSAVLWKQTFERRAGATFKYRYRPDTVRSRFLSERQETLHSRRSPTATPKHHGPGTSRSMAVQVMLVGRMRVGMSNRHVTVGMAVRADGHRLVGM